MSLPFSFSPDEERLIDRLQKIEALFAGATTPGEKKAAGSALDRIREKLAVLERTEKPAEYKFTMPDTWSKALFVSLLRRYGLEPFRYPRQRRTTVVVYVAPSFVDEVLWPEFKELNKTLHQHLHDVTMRVIKSAIHDGDLDAEDLPELP